MKTKLLLLLLLVVLLGCDLRFISPDSSFTGSWEYTYRGAGYLYSSSEYKFDNSNLVTEYYYHNDYQYFDAAELNVFYYIWKVSGNVISMRLADQYGNYNQFASWIDYTFTNNGYNLVLTKDGLSYTYNRK